MPSHDRLALQPPYPPPPVAVRPEVDLDPAMAVEFDLGEVVEQVDEDGAGRKVLDLDGDQAAVGGEVVQRGHGPSGLLPAHMAQHRSMGVFEYLVVRPI